MIRNDALAEKVLRYTFNYFLGFSFTTSLYWQKRANWIERDFIKTPYANDITPWGSFPNTNFPSPYVRETLRSQWKCPLVGAAWPVTLLPVLKMDPKNSFNDPLTSWLFY